MTFLFWRGIVIVVAKQNRGVFPSGQRGQTVNLLSVTSVVRIHPLPPKNRLLFIKRRFLFCPTKGFWRASRPPLTRGLPRSRWGRENRKSNQHPISPSASHTLGTSLVRGRQGVAANLCEIPKRGVETPPPTRPPRVGERKTASLIKIRSLPPPRIRSAPPSSEGGKRLFCAFIH